MSQNDREFDLILWGATGFTGQLVAEHLLERHAAGPLRWALGGRDTRKLEGVRDALGPGGEALALVTGDATDAALADLSPGRAGRL
jgi:short subunit dehydrogenase-like uncharacterized protein